MNQDQFPRSAWYAAPAPAAPQRPGRQRRPHTGAKIAGIALCVLLVLVGSVYVFSEDFRFRLSAPEGDAAPPSGGQDGGGLPDSYSGDYRDYFSRYYEAIREDDSGPSAVQRTDSFGDFRMTLVSAEGKAEGTLQTLYPECMESIVTVQTTVSGRPGYYQGSGIVLSEDGYILTNQHLLAGTDRAYVTLPDGARQQALLVGEDESTDLAVLKIEAEGLRPAEFGESDELTVGDGVFAIGNPSSLTGTLSSGIISGVSRSVSSYSHAMTLIQTTTPINEGSSGGALFNLYGQVVGVTNMKFVNYYSEVPIEGICFAIPSATAKTVTDQLLSTGRYVRPGIGITVGPIGEAEAEHYELPEGLYITAVSPGSDAKAKGVLPGDILLAIDGERVRESADVLAIRDAKRVGDTITLTIFREGETIEITVELVDYSKIY